MNSVKEQVASFPVSCIRYRSGWDMRLYVRIPAMLIKLPNKQQINKAASLGVVNCYQEGFHPALRGKKRTLKGHRNLTAPFSDTR